MITLLLARVETDPMIINHVVVDIDSYAWPQFLEMVDETLGLGVAEFVMLEEDDFVAIDHAVDRIFLIFVVLQQTIEVIDLVHMIELRCQRLVSLHVSATHR